MATPSSFSKLLAIPSKSPSQLRHIYNTYEKKRQTIEEAIRWPSSHDVNAPKYHPVFENEGYEVCLGKPGKETTRQIRPNPNDMVPKIFKNGEILDFRGGFEDIFRGLEGCLIGGSNALEIVGCLLVRCAFMLDHKEISPGIWRYSPSNEILVYLEKRVAMVSEMPLRVFLHFLDALGWNEDVKYYTLRYDIKSSVGRENTLLTCAHFITVPLGRLSYADVAAAFVRGRGVSPLSLSKAPEIFPLLTAMQV